MSEVAIISTTISIMKTILPLDALRTTFSDRLQENVPLAPYTSARIGGPADALLILHSADELAEAINCLWAMDVPYTIIGGGSNVLVSDRGIRGVVVLNRAKALHLIPGRQPTVWAESGVTLGNLAHRVAESGLAGLEWAANIPGTIGGAIYGNAGAFDGDMAGSLHYAELLTEHKRERWPVEKMEYGYRTSILKQQAVKAFILSAELRLINSSKEAVQEKIRQFAQRRRESQPPGASMGSMFKNPPGDSAGRLIEAAGLKGTRIGNAEISMKHANFFINHGETKGSDIHTLIYQARDTIAKKFGVTLELEIELIGDWQ